MLIKAFIMNVPKGKIIQINILKKGIFYFFSLLVTGSSKWYLSKEDPV